MSGDFEYYVDADGTHVFKCARHDCEFKSYGWATRELCMRRASEHHNEHVSGDNLTAARNRLHTTWDVIESLPKDHPSRPELHEKLEKARMDLVDAEAGIQYMTEMTTFMRKWA